MIAFIICLIILIVLILFVRNIEKKEWNNGYCTCGTSWKYIIMDSQYRRGYICKKCNKHIWISYKVDKYKINK